jgi:hypothetical protein
MLAMPVFVTVTTDFVSVDPTRLPPKSKLVALIVALETAGVMERAAVAVWESESDEPVTVTVAEVVVAAEVEAESRN